MWLLSKDAGCGAFKQAAHAAVAATAQLLLSHAHIRMVLAGASQA